MQGIYSKLQLVSIILGVAGILGGFVYTWGTYNQRLDALEQKDFVINQTVDLSGIKKDIKELDNDVSVQLQFLQEEIQKANVEININKATLEYLDAKLLELKQENNNPLLNGLGL